MTTAKDQASSTAAEHDAPQKQKQAGGTPEAATAATFEGPNWTGDPAAYTAGAIFHAPTDEQAAKGWTQNWDEYRTAGDVVKLKADGSRSTFMSFDLTGGPAVVAYKAAEQQKAAVQEAQEFQVCVFPCWAVVVDNKRCVMWARRSY
jgi:hypothetical protein